MERGGKDHIMPDEFNELLQYVKTVLISRYADPETTGLGAPMLISRFLTRSTGRSESRVKPSSIDYQILFNPKSCVEPAELQHERIELCNA